MPSLIGRSPNTSFRELLKIDQDNGLSSGLASVTDGKGAASPLSLSTTQISLGGAKWPASTGPVGTVLSVGENNQLQWVPMQASGGIDDRYDLAFATNGTPVAGNIFLFTAPRAFVLPAGLTGSVAGALQAPQYDATLSIHKKIKGGTSTKVASIKFLQGSTVGTFTATADIGFAVGDMIYVKLDAADSTFSDVAITLIGSLT
jgi:hypothetical protein